MVNITFLRLSHAHYLSFVRDFEGNLSSILAISDKAYPLHSDFTSIHKPDSSVLLDSDCFGLSSTDLVVNILNSGYT